MTIQSTSAKAGPFLGNGATTVFPFAFKVFKKQDLRVVHADQFGSESDLVLDSQFSVTLNADQNQNPGGSITYPISGSPMPDPERLVVISNVPNTQPTSLSNSSGFYPQTIEAMSDRSTLQIQQLVDELDSTLALRVTATDGVGGYDAHGNRIINLGDAQGEQDAVNKRYADTGDATSRNYAEELVAGVVGGPGFFQQDFVGSVPRTFQDKMRDTVSVRDFGAKGDGTADDTAAIQAALNVNNARIVFPPGTYRITETLHIGNGSSASVSTIHGVWMEGSGAGITTSEFGPAGATCAIIWDGVANGTMLEINGPIYGVNLSGLTLDCAGVANTGVNAKHNCCSHWVNVLVERYCGDAYVFGAYQVPTAMAVGASDSTYFNVSAKHPGPNGCGAAFGESSGLPGNLDVARNVWIQCEWWRDGTSAVTYSARFQFIDNCTFIECATTAQGGAAGVGIHVAPPVGVEAFPAAITFLNCPIIGGFAATTGWIADEGFLFWPFPVGDGELVPEASLPKQVYGMTSRGDYFGGFSIGVGGSPIAKHLSATAELSFGAVAANSMFERAMTVGDAEVGDVVNVSVQGSLPPGLILTGYVDTTSNVVVRWVNATTGAVIAPTTTYRADVWKH